MMCSSGEAFGLFMGGFIIFGAILFLCWAYDIIKYNGKPEECFLCNLDLCTFCWCGTRRRNAGANHSSV